MDISLNVMKSKKDNGIEDMQQGWTNAILWLQKESFGLYYLPGYLRLQVNSISSMQLQELKAEMNATIKFTLFYGGMSQEVVQHLEHNLILDFNRDNAIQLTGTADIQCINNAQNQTLNFKVRRLFQTRITADIFFAPFQIINLVLTIKVRPLLLNLEKQGLVKIVVNLMDCPNLFHKISYAEEGSFGDYDVAQARLKASYSNERVVNDYHYEFKSLSKRSIVGHARLKFDHYRKEENEYHHKYQHKSHIHSFEYGHFIVPLYKHPLVSLMTIFYPLWLLAVINMGIFFETENLGDRIAAISALAIAFIALIPTIRSEIPPNPSLTLTEVLIYIETLTSVLALVRSLAVRDIAHFDQQWAEDNLFLSCVVMTVLTFLVVLVLLLIHVCYWEPSYLKIDLSNYETHFDKNHWVNPQCDQYFKQFPQIEIYQDKPQ